MCVHPTSEWTAKAFGQLANEDETCHHVLYDAHVRGLQAMNHVQRLCTRTCLRNHTNSNGTLSTPNRAINSQQAIVQTLNVTKTLLRTRSTRQQRQQRQQHSSDIWKHLTKKTWVPPHEPTFQLTFAQLEIGCNKSTRRMDQRDDGPPGREWNTHGCLGGITQNSSARTTTDSNANTPLHTMNNWTDGVGVPRYLVATSTTSKHTCTMQRTTRYEDKRQHDNRFLE